MRFKKAWRWTSALGLITLTAGALVWFGPFAQSQDRPPFCSLADDPLQPDQPLELNQVVKGNFVKTLAMEKEVFVCRGDEDRDGIPDRIVQVRDVETYIEIVEMKVLKGKVERMTTVERSVYISTCTKDFQRPSVNCAMSPQITEMESISLDILASCRPHPDSAIQPHDPVEMETVGIGRTLVKTTKVEKEVLECDGRVVDMYLFTDIIERQKGKTIRPFANLFFGILCIKETPAETLGGVDPRRCFQFRPSE